VDASSWRGRRWMTTSEHSTAESAATVGGTEAERISATGRSFLRFASLQLALACLGSIAASRAARAQAAHDSRLPRAFAGCYALNLARESGPPPSSWYVRQIPPAHFRLDTARVAHPFPGLVVQPAFLGAPPARMPVPAVWNPLAPDSIRIVWSDGYVGVRLELRARGDTLIGRAMPFQDAVFTGDPPPPVASAVAIRTPCPP